MDNSTCNLNRNELKRLSDEELIHLKSCSNIATEILIERYKKYASLKANKYFAKGAEREDIIQEAMIGIFEAIGSFNEEFNTSFRTFVNLVMERKIFNLLEKQNSRKNRFMNDALSISNDNLDGEFDEIDISKGMGMHDPSSIIIDMESVEKLNEKIEKELSSFERDVFFSYIKGYTYSEISIELNIDLKAVDNAIQRIRKKLR